MQCMKHYSKKFQAFKALLAKEDPIILEIGAHYGEDSLRFAEIFRNPTIYCFEPDPRNIQIFKKHVSNSRIQLFPIALSDKKGTLPFYPSYQQCEDLDVPQKYDWISHEDYNDMALNSSGASSLKRGYEHAGPPIEVNVERFDSWYVQGALDKIDLVWIDVQGAEKEVVNGMGIEIKNVQYLWIEYGESTYEGAMSRHQTIKLLEEKGFGVLEELSDVAPNGDIMFYNKELK